MAQKVARIGDTVLCNCSQHGLNRTGTIQGGSGTVTADGVGVARLGDTGRLSCNHFFRISGASNVSFADGIRIARVGDAVEIVPGQGVSGIGTIQTGSPNVDSD
jgi:uncharacterized Zn-binding protein involved in type VI secretion